jgi:hypothetical protein
MNWPLLVRKHLSRLKELNVASKPNYSLSARFNDRSGMKDSAE